MELECIVFDVDGTLIPNANDLIILFQDIVQRYLFKTLSKNEILALWGPPDDQIFREIFPPNIIDAAWSDFLTIYEESHIDKGYFSKAELFLLKKHIRYLAIFTGKGKITCNISLNKLKIIDFFDLVLTGNDVKRSKPYPDALFQIIEILKLNKAKTIFIGDSHLDIISGKEAGIITAGALWGTIEAEKLINSTPDYLFNSPQEFLDFILGKK